MSGVGTTYNYSASFSGGKYFGTVYAAGVAIGTVEAKSERALKGRAKALAEKHHRDNIGGETHGVSKSAFGTFDL